MHPVNCSGRIREYISGVMKDQRAGMRRVSSAQLLPMDFLMSSFTPLNAGAGNTICQIRVMFSRSSCPIKGNN